MPVEIILLKNKVVPLHLLKIKESTGTVGIPNGHGHGHCTGTVQDLDVVTKCSFRAAGRGPGIIGAAEGLLARSDGTHIVINRLHHRKKRT